MTQIRISSDAANDIDEILKHLDKVSGWRTADRYRDQFRKRIGDLQRWPELARLRPTLGAETRIVVVKPYLLIYDYNRAGNLVSILRIMHERRDVTDRMIHPSDRT
jgi:plasmid stabilization system protein ParE